MSQTVDDVLRALVRHLPFPAVLYGPQPNSVVANDRFLDVFVPGQHDSLELRRLKSQPGGSTTLVKLLRQDGRDLWSEAHATSAGDHVLVSVNDAATPMLIRENERLRERLAELENLNVTDALTGTLNRAQFERVVAVEINRALRSGQPVTLLLLDIDHFKQVNDMHGHLVGDAVLKEFTARIRGRMRETDSLFRWGGDEFVLLATSVGYRGGAVLAESLRRAIASTPMTNVGRVSASIGVAEYVGGESAPAWLQRTDQALYAAKSAGRDRIHVDRRGSSDQGQKGVLRLYWLEAYECGEPSIDDDHRQLFTLGNALIAAAIEQPSNPAAVRNALDSLLSHLAVHFQEEEALLRRTGYPQLTAHQRAHAQLLQQANEIRDAFERGEAALGRLVNFLVNDVVALHLLKIDRDFFQELRSDGVDHAFRSPLPLPVRAGLR